MSTDPDAPDVPTANAQTDSARTVTGLDDTGATLERDGEKPVPFDGLLDALAYVTAKALRRHRPSDITGGTPLATTC